jgi:nicotinate-nucleotide pyrophosphorylase (carboxylating)
LAQSIQHTKAKLLDTRKTLPGLRYAQKYAVRLGGGENHRIGLFDAFLIKENHILAAGGIDAAIRRARAHAPEKRLEIEVETLAELETAIAAQPDWIMLDNFTLDGLRAAVSITPSSIKLEASGGIEGQKTLIDIAETGVDYISVGALTKHCKAIDLSLRFAELPC